MSTPVERKQLAYWIEQEIGSAKALLDILEQERTALQERAAERLGEITGNKLACAQKYNQVAARRDHFLGVLQLPPGKPGIEQLLARLEIAGDAGLKPRWQELQTLAIRCQHLNQINGGIVELSRRHIRRALDLLRGQEHGTELYGPAGNNTGRRTGHTLAVA